MILRHSGKLAGFVVAVFLVLAGSVDSLSQTVAGVEQEPTPSEFEKPRDENANAALKLETIAPIDLTRSIANVSKTAVPRSFPAGVSDETAAFDKMRADINASRKQSSSGWQFGFAPYLYATGIHGTVAVQGRELEIDSSFGNVLSNLDLGLMGAFEARKGKVSVFTDMMWIKLSAERDTPFGLYGAAKVGINLFILDPEVGYQIAGSDKGRLDVVGGARIWSVETNLNVSSGALPGFDVSQRKTWAAPVVGLRGVYDLTSRFYLSSKFDIGGFGIGADLTTQFYGGVGYRFTKHIAAVGGYRFLMVDYDDDEGFLFDTNMNGFLFGVKFTF